MIAVSELARSRSEAKTENRKFYFTGKPCVNGHTSIRYVSGECVECAKISARDWHTKNPDKVRQKGAAWAARNPDKLRRKNASEQKRANNAKWQKENCTKRRVTMTRWREANREKAQTATERWQANNPDKVRHYVRKRRARKNGSVEHCTPEQIAGLKKKAGNTCWACRRKKIVTVDHIIPLSKGGSDAIRNIQFLCKSCNSAKRDKDPEDFARYLGRLL